MNNLSTRQNIIEKADDLFYQQGFDNTSFSQIASEVGISKGNFYYHFKTKDQILDAVINGRIAKTNSMLDKWQIEGSTPKARILSFINILIMNKAKIKKYGCPVGSLCSELSKLNHEALSHANELLTLFRVWLKKQFQQLGYNKQADELAMHLLSQSQGIATLANAFNDEKFIKREVKLLTNWLDNYPQK